MKFDLLKAFYKRVIRYLHQQGHSIYLRYYVRAKNWVIFLLRSPQMSRLYRIGQKRSPDAGTVLFWVTGGPPTTRIMEGAIAAALQLRGIPVHAVICDAPFTACGEHIVTQNVPLEHWRDSCKRCGAEASATLKHFRIPFSFIGDYVPESVRSELWEKTESVTWDTLDSLCYRDINLGKNARSSVYRYLQGYELGCNEEVVRQYAFTALVMAAAASTAMDRISPSRIFITDVASVDWGPAFRTAFSRKLPVTTWAESYLRCHFLYRHIEDENSMHFHGMSQNAWDKCNNGSVQPNELERLKKYLENRYEKRVGFNPEGLAGYDGDIPRLREKYSLAPEKPVWGIMPHVNWDNVFDYSPMLYPTFDEWMIDTIRIISSISDVNWLIKIHPAEAWGNPESGVERLIERHFPSLPDNVRVIPAKEILSPLEFYELVDGGVTVYGTPGLELSLLGKPVILAGTSYYGGKGFTHDASSIDEYRQLLGKAKSLELLSEEQRLLAQKYAYCLYIQRQVPLPVVKDPHSIKWTFQYGKRNLLLPGNDPFIDFVCERILDGKDFIMDERLVALSEKHE